MKKFAAFLSAMATACTVQARQVQISCRGEDGKSIVYQGENDWRIGKSMSLFIDGHPLSTYRSDFNFGTFNGRAINEAVIEVKWDSKNNKSYRFNLLGCEAPRRQTSLAIQTLDIQGTKFYKPVTVLCQCSQ